MIIRFCSIAGSAGSPRAWKLLAVVGLFIGAECPLAWGQTTLLTPVSYAVGSQPQTVALADVNSDGKQDIVTANISSNTVSVLLGALPAGTFNAHQDYATGTAPLGVAVGDVNGDGRADIITANLNGNSVSVLLGSATVPGSFGPGTAYATGASPRTVALGDVNGDGMLDIVNANFTTGTVSVLLSSRALPGTFGPPTAYAADTGTQGVALGDLNRDGQLDIVTANVTAGSVSVLLGATAVAGTFAPAVQYTAGPGSGPVSVALGDVNKDGYLDVVTANFSGSTASVFLGSTAVPGTLTARRDYALAAGSSPTGIALGDIRKDGRLSIITSNAGAETVSVLPNQGLVSGLFGPRMDYKAGIFPNGLGVADMNGDGYLDVVVANETTVSLLLNSATPLAAASASETVAFAVFPNPAYRTLTVRLPATVSATTVHAELQNALGQVVRQQEVTWPAGDNQFQVEVVGLAAGLYTLRIQVGNSLYNKQISLLKD